MTRFNSLSLRYLIDLSSIDIRPRYLDLISGSGGKPLIADEMKD